MKYTIKNIQSFIKNEKMIFILVLLCIITSSFIINFSYGLYQNYNVIKEEESSEFTEIDIMINDNDSVTKEKIKDCVFSVSDKTNDALKMYLVFPILEEFYNRQDDDWNRLMNRFVVKDNTIRPSEYFAQTLIDNGNMISGEYFTDEQEINGDLVALVTPPLEDQTFKDTMVDCTSEITTRVEGDKRWVKI